MDNGTIQTKGRTVETSHNHGPVLIVGMGEMIATHNPSATLITYALGSCVAVAIYDATARVGGLLHAMLPDSKINPERATQRPFMFVDTGLFGLFHAAYELGAAKERLQVTIAGGAQFLDPNHVFDIGRRNTSASLEILARNGLIPVASACGGRHSRTLRMDLETGRIELNCPGYGRQIL